MRESFDRVENVRLARQALDRTLDEREVSRRGKNVKVARRRGMSDAEGAASARFVDDEADGERADERAIPGADSTAEAPSETSPGPMKSRNRERGRTRSNAGLYTAYSSGQGCGSLAIPSHVNRLRDFQESAMQNKRFLSPRPGTYDRLEHRARVPVIARGDSESAEGEITGLRCASSLALTPAIRSFLIHASRIER